MSEKKSGDACDDACSQNPLPDSSDTTPQIASSSPRRHGPRFVITFTPGPGVDGIRNLRLLLKAAKRRFGLVATDAYEDRSAPLPISNQAADEFRNLRDEVVAERAQTWRRP